MAYHIILTLLSKSRSASLRLRNACYEGDVSEIVHILYHLEYCSAPASGGHQYINHTISILNIRSQDCSSFHWGYIRKKINSK